MFVGCSGGSLLGPHAWNLSQIDGCWRAVCLCLSGVGGSRAWGHKVSDGSLIGEAKGKAKPDPREPKKCEPWGHKKIPKSAHISCSFWLPPGLDVKGILKGHEMRDHFGLAMRDRFGIALWRYEVEFWYNVGGSICPGEAFETYRRSCQRAGRHCGETPPSRRHNPSSFQGSSD